MPTMHDNPLAHDRIRAQQLCRALRGMGLPCSDKQCPRNRLLALQSTEELKRKADKSRRLRGKRWTQEQFEWDRRVWLATGKKEEL